MCEAIEHAGLGARVLFHAHLTVMKGLETTHKKDSLAQGTAHVGAWRQEQVSGPHSWCSMRGMRWRKRARMMKAHSIKVCHVG